MSPAPLTVEARVERDDFELDLDFSAEPGDIVGITGDIGSGKSTALWLVAGRLRAAAGTIRYGSDVWDDPAAGRLVTNRPVTLLTQLFQADLAEDRTGVENLTDAIVRRLPDHLDPDADARRLLARLGVQEHVVDRLPWTFSGAEAQRVALAKALAPQPSVVLLDEPLGALDKRTRAAVRDELERWFSEFEGIVLLATARPDDLDRFADRVIVLG